MIATLPAPLSASDATMVAAGNMFSHTAKSAVSQCFLEKRNFPSVKPSPDALTLPDVLNGVGINEPTHVPRSKARTFSRIPFPQGRQQIIWRVFRNEVSPSGGMRYRGLVKIGP